MKQITQFFLEGERPTLKNLLYPLFCDDAIQLLVTCSEIPHTQILHHVATMQLDYNKSQITGFRKTRDNRTGKLRTDPVIKVNMIFK